MEIIRKHLEFGNYFSVILSLEYRDLSIKNYLILCGVYTHETHVDHIYVYLHINIYICIQGDLFLLCARLYPGKNK